MPHTTVTSTQTGSYCRIDSQHRKVFLREDLGLGIDSIITFFYYQFSVSFVFLVFSPSRLYSCLLTGLNRTWTRHLYILCIIINNRFWYIGFDTYICEHKYFHTIDVSLNTQYNGQEVYNLSFSLFYVNLRCVFDLYTTKLLLDYLVRHPFGLHRTFRPRGPRTSPSACVHRLLMVNF